MARTNDFSRVLWLVTSAWLAGCGRIGFGESDHDSTNVLPDAPADIDAAVIKGPPVVSVSAPDNLTSVCGDGATLSSVTVTNSGETDLVITDLATRDGVFKVTTDAPVTVAPGSSVEIQIKVPAAVIGTDIGGRSKTDQLMFGANVQIEPVALTTKVMGANIQITNPPPPMALAFSSASGCPLPRAVSLRNAGNMAATVNMTAPAAFAITGTSGASIGMGSSIALTLRPFTSSACSGTGIVQYNVTGAPNCGASGIGGPTLNATFNITGTSSCFCS